MIWFGDLVKDDYAAVRSASHSWSVTVATILLGAFEYFHEARISCNSCLNFSSNIGSCDLIA